MFPTTLALLVFAAQPTSLAIPRFQAPAPLEKLARLSEDALAGDLAHRGADVLRANPDSAGALQQSLNACGADPGACTPALASALHVQFFIRGALIAQPQGQRFAVSLLDAAGHPLLSRTLDSPNDWTLVDQVHQVAGEIALELSRRLDRRLDQNAPRRRLAPWLMAGGGASILGGLVLCGLAAGDAGRLDEEPTDLADTAEAYDVAHAGALKQGLGFGFIAAGALTAGIGAFLYLRSRPNQPRVVVGLSPSRDGAGLTVSGVLP